MDVTSWLLRHTPPRPLVVALPGGTGARLAVERTVRERGWRTATSPAGANMLVIAGPAGNAAHPYLEHVWVLLPAPRARVHIGSAATTGRELDAAVRTLRDVDHQRAQAESPGAGQPDTNGPESNGAESNGAESNGSGTAGAGAGQHDMDGHDMGGMEMPGKVPMADRAEDRDGLVLDQLHVPLGPALHDWPAGLVVRASLQGDVIQAAAVEAVGLDEVHHEPFWSGPPPDLPAVPGAAVVPDEHRLIARRLDSCGRLLSVAGWADASATARWLRDEALHGAWTAEAVRSFASWARRVRRSRTLRWSLAGIGAVPDDPGTPPGLRGDALTRLYRWVDSAGRAFDKSGSAPPDQSGVDGPRVTRWTFDVLPALLAGTELATARLIVASLDPDLEALAREGVHHG